MNKECLKCKKAFEAKRESAKFCSTSCRVMYNRKNPSPQKRVIEVKLEVLYNSLLEMVGKINYGVVPTILDAPRIADLRHDEPMFPPKPKIRRSYENYQQLKLDCESVEAWEELKTEILASDLPQRQKTLLTT